MTTCTSCRMRIPFGARVCPFCRADRHSAGRSEDEFHEQILRFLLSMFVFGTPLGLAWNWTPIPAFTKAPDGKVGMVRRQCTAEYKIDVVDRAIRRELLGLKPRQRIPKDVVVHQYFGISTDEAARAERAKKRFASVRHTVPHRPLIDMGWSRKDCLAYLKDKLPYDVPKSSCVFCPYRTNQSWLNLKQTDPDG